MNWPVNRYIMSERYVPYEYTWWQRAGLLAACSSTAGRLPHPVQTSQGSEGL